MRLNLCLLVFGVPFYLDHLPLLASDEHLQCLDLRVESANLVLLRHVKRPLFGLPGPVGAFRRSQRVLFHEYLRPQLSHSRPRHLQVLFPQPRQLLALILTTAGTIVLNFSLKQLQVLDFVLQ